MQKVDYVKKAKVIAIHEHWKAGQMYGGEPYKYHLKQVVTKVNFLYNDSPKIKSLRQVAWMHDLIEDIGHVSDIYLLSLGFSVEVVEAVLAISKVDGETLDQYYDRVAANKLAFKVKIADTLTNLEHSLRAGQTKRINKYTTQIQELYLRKSK